MPLVFPADVLTFDVDEIAHIQHLGCGYAKFWLAGAVPVMTNGAIVSHRLVKVAFVWPMTALPCAIRKAQAAAASFALLTPDDFMGEPKGHG